MKQQGSLFDADELEDTPLKVGLIAHANKIMDPFAPRPVRNGQFFIIYGNVPSKSNCYRIITFKPKKDAEPKIVKCDSCEGTGRVDIEGANVKCGFCDGSGEVEKMPQAHASLAKTPELKKYEKDFDAQWVYLISNTWQTIIGEFAFEMNVFYPTKRSDLDNSLKVVLDCLQTAGAIKNDNNCVDIHVRKQVDKNNPRIEFKIIPL